MDLTRIVVTHGRARVTASARVRDLRPGSARVADLDLLVPGRDLYTASLTARGVSLTRYGGSEVDCPGLSAAFHDTRDRVTWSVPRSCLGSPRWVRPGVSLLRFPGASGLRSLFDDGLRRGLDPAQPIGLGPRIPRG